MSGNPLPKTLAVATCAALLLTALATPAVAAPTSCRVKNLDTGITHRGLQVAVIDRDLH